MAGYIFTLNNIDSLNKIIEDGIYSTNLNIPKNNTWKPHHEGTLADYLSMTEGDNVYFFIKRKIYGIGKLITIAGDCKLLNFPKADIPIVNDYKNLQDKMILNSSEENLKNRFLCTFIGAPAFFKEGIDMDDVLESNPNAFKMLRVLWKLSFIKIDDIENKALFDMILKSNEKYINNHLFHFNFSSNMHNRVKQLYNEEYTLNSKNTLILAAQNNEIKHEMAIEASLIDYIKKNSSGIFGRWDYLSHQVVASPFKPVDYMDKMDVFGYRFIEGYKSTISKYLVVEIKKDVANVDVVNQVMKYVDWVNREYSYGDYNMIEAFIVAKDFEMEVIELKDSIAKRNFTQGRRPPISHEWSNLRLIKYSYNIDSQQLEFEEVI
ncbi:hypothetical protein ACH0B5_10925 [Ureibacillus sp. 179-F W5.1 NHS]|uniref:hypothetical protein n=1 Tax=Ureibacillus sp. 179-F W5.1 NHS TaxID=3374297 RepID=UPI003879A6BC